jgi:hypothetical protein
MHRHIHQSIDDKVSISPDVALVGKNSLLRWLRVNKICSPENDAERQEYIPMYSENQALTWFNDNVDGFFRQKNRWTFKEVITGLYDRFVHDSATHHASDKFWHVKYNAMEGVMAFYHELERDIPLE